MGKENTQTYDGICIGNVIRIVDKHTVLVNVGKSALKAGNIIQIYELGEMIKDLDGTDIAPFIYVKDELEVVRAEERYSICKKMKHVKKTITFPLSPLLTEEREKIEYIPMHIEESDVQELVPKEALVKIGDPIKLA